MPLGLSRNGISIRAIDCRYSDICYVSGAWIIYFSDDSTIELHDLLYIKQKIDDWNSLKLKQEEAQTRAKEDMDFPDFVRHQMSYIVTSTRGVYEQRQTVYPRIQNRSS